METLFIRSSDERHQFIKILNEPIAMRAYLLPLLLLFIFSSILNGQSLNRIEISSEQNFASGGNIAWINFARDIGPGETRLDLYEEMFEELSQNGGNMVRIWLHTNGTSTPEFDGMDVAGPGVGAIKRTAPDALVTNGSWNIRASSDIGSFHNYYRDDRLIEAGGEFVRLEASGSLTWSDIEVNESGNYQLTIGFRLPYESPKSQFFFVNGDEIGEIEFSGTENEWLSKRLDIDLVSGPNTIHIEDSWGYMDFDYIEIRGQNLLTSSGNNEELATKYDLGQNYPNRFNPATVIPFSIANRSHVQLDVYDVAGRRVATLVNESLSAGSHEVRFDAGRFSSGIYFYRITADNFDQARRMVLIKCEGKSSRRIGTAKSTQEKSSPLPVLFWSRVHFAGRGDENRCSNDFLRGVIGAATRSKLFTGKLL